MRPNRSLGGREESMLLLSSSSKSSAPTSTSNSPSLIAVILVDVVADVDTVVAIALLFASSTSAVCFFNAGLIDMGV